eukprot:CAMPEP_0203760572 /NCGR_PEP_ID=MMETSP0098-20131031/13834_1 /ASSEMBLY_ACC=CAM_ASM_000208 /TAXON_ID=96639 /ORGANISM=" , Strain NY0313808BC1" /LENGTH=213 /DNA_ID=CAMNT_0050654193 /DNA_START=932 /DNA_END=1573 /DNA_ORIENTATION=+
MMIGIWGVLLYKIRECAVWPEEVVFRRDGLIAMELGCGVKTLNTANGGVTIYKKSLGSLKLWEGLGVWCNAVTDKTRDDIFVLVPTTGPIYWTGFAFQPEDPNSFLHDCSHAGVIFSESVQSGGNSVAMVEPMMGGEFTQTEGRQSLLGNSHMSSLPLTTTTQEGDQAEQDDSQVSPEPTECYEEDEESLPEDSFSPTTKLIESLKNNNIVEV